MAVIYYIITVAFLLYWYLTKNYNYWQNQNVPFPKPLPIIGNILNGVLMRVSFGKFFHDLYQKTKEPILGFYVFTKPGILIRDPEIIKRVLVTDFQYFYDRNVLDNKRDDPISTRILFILKNPEWRELRTKISPVYSTAKIKAMSSLVEYSAKEMKDYLEEETKTKSVFDIKEVVLKFTVNVITSTAFGVNANSFQDEKSKFFVEAKKLLNWDDFLTAFRIRCYLLAHSVVKIFRMKLFNPGCIDFLSDSFWKIMEERAASKKIRNDLIDILLQLKNNDKNFLDGDLLTSQAVVFFLAGFETSSSTITFALNELAFNPEIQKKLRNEIDEVSKKHGGINYNSLNEMKYLDMCVKETLRKYPVIPTLERRCNTQYTIPETGTLLEKDTPVFISTWSLHYDPEYFADPEVFNPERFSEENKDLINTYTYLPFGQGPRNCIGARFGLFTVKTGLATILQNFVLEPSDESSKKIKFHPYGFMLSALHGIKLKVKKIVD